MSYIGNTPTNQNFVAGADQFNGDGSTTAFTLSRNVNTVFDIFVAISNVPQDPYSAYSVSGNTLTFTSAPPSGTGNIYVVYRATNVQTFVPSPGATIGGSFGIQGNLNFYGTGNRITGDFSNATVANRVMFQTSTANSATSIYAIPSGTSSTSQFVAVNNSDPTNASVLQLQVNATDYQIRGGITGTGTYLPMTFYTSGSERMRIDTAGITKFRNTGSAYDSTPGDGVSDGLYLQVDSSGIAHIDSYAGGGSTNLAFGTNSGGGAVGERMRIDSSGNVGIGTSSPASRLHLSGNDSTGPAQIKITNTTASATRNIGVSNSNQLVFERAGVATDALIDSSGNFAIPTSYSHTTASAANTFMRSDGYLQRSTSALKYKQDVRDYSGTDINALRPVLYKSKCDGDDQTKDHLGIVADEAHEAGITELVTYGAEGEVEGFQYERLTVVLLKAMQEQQQMIETLQAEVAALKGAA